MSLVPTPGASSPLRPIHSQMVVNSIVEKLLVNISVISRLQVGDKLGWTASGHFYIQQPGYWTTATRILNRHDRWASLTRIQDVISTAESMLAITDGKRICLALKKSVHGIRNFQTTYEDDVLMHSSLNVLLDRLAERFNFDETELL